MSSDWNGASNWKCAKVELGQSFPCCHLGRCAFHAAADLRSKSLAALKIEQLKIKES